METEKPSNSKENFTFEVTKFLTPKRSLNT